VRDSAPFQPADLADLDERLLAHAIAVIPMADVAAGQRRRRVIGLRHDVDNSIEPAVAFAEWEAELGYRSTYFILHTAPYWRDKPLLRRSLDRIAQCGHELGIHNNAIAAALLTGNEPAAILEQAIAELRGYGFDIRGTVAHGDPLCYGPDRTLRFVNDEIFDECARPTLGDSSRRIGAATITPAPLAELGLDYDANWVGPRTYLSDSGGRWSDPGFDQTAEGFPFEGQLHMLVHPDWWAEAFAAETVPA
jgi:hypothetical protein